jgi:hypothetical protein
VLWIFIEVLLLVHVVVVPGLCVHRRRCGYGGRLPGASSWRGSSGRPSSGSPGLRPSCSVLGGSCRCPSDWRWGSARCSALRRCMGWCRASGCVCCMDCPVVATGRCLGAPNIMMMWVVVCERQSASR